MRRDLVGLGLCLLLALLLIANCWKIALLEGELGDARGALVARTVMAAPPLPVAAPALIGDSVCFTDNRFTFKAARDLSHTVSTVIVVKDGPTGATCVMANPGDRR